MTRVPRASFPVYDHTGWKRSVLGLGPQACQLCSLVWPEPGRVVNGVWPQETTSCWMMFDKMFILVGFGKDMLSL